MTQYQNGHPLAKAFQEAASILGERGSEVLFDHLTKMGLQLSSQSLTVDQLSSCLRTLSGDWAAQLLMERTLMKLDRSECH
jgi:hypothetical protein